MYHFRFACLLLFVIMSTGLISAKTPTVLPNILDLGHALNEASMAWDPKAGFAFTKKLARYMVPPNNTWYAANELATPEHIGTHLDAPYHFNESGWTVAQIPVEHLIAEGILSGVI